MKQTGQKNNIYFVVAVIALIIIIALVLLYIQPMLALLLLSAAGIIFLAAKLHIIVSGFKFKKIYIHRAGRSPPKK